MARPRKTPTWLDDLPAEIAMTVTPDLIVETVAAINDLEQQLREIVYVAREMGGATWQQIADLLGVSRSAAWQRFAATDPESEGWLHWGDRLDVPDDLSSLTGYSVRG